MHTMFSGKHIDISDSLRAWVEERLQALTARHVPQAIEAGVVFGRERSFFTCDLTIHAGHHMTMRGHGRADEIHAACQDAIGNVEAQLRRSHKQQTEHARGEVLLTQAID